jgi:rod shape-determining protein MreC
MRDRSIVLWVILGAVLLVVLNLPGAVSGQVKAVLREGISPLQGALSGCSRWVRESVRSVRGIGGLMRENQQMSAELVRLRNEVRDLQGLSQDNAELREQLQFVAQAKRRLTPCEVIARDITGWWETIRLSKGSSDGVSMDMAVITSEGLIGKTVDVSSRTCDVLLISDPVCKVSARIARTGAFGVVSGIGPARSGQAACRMEFINKNVPVLPGDEVVASGLGGIFPKGLLIGCVEKITMDETGLFQRADIIPKADLGMLTYVFVVAEQGNAVDEYLKKVGPLEGGEP